VARWQVTLNGKGLRKTSVEKLVEKMKAEFGEGVNVLVVDASPPESRADRFSDAIGLVSTAREEFETLRDELQEWRDGLPENLQGGSKAEELDQAISDLEDAVQDAENLEGKDVTFPGMY